MALERKKTTAAVKQERFLDGALIPLISSQHTITGEHPYRLAYGYRTIGSRRYYAAKVSDEILSMMVAVPLTDATMDLFTADGAVEIRSNRTGTRKLLAISQVEIKYDSLPPSIYLSLKEPGIALTDNRKETSYVAK